MGISLNTQNNNNTTYKKTNLNRTTGLIVGTGVSAYHIIKSVNTMKSFSGRRLYINTYNNFKENYPDFVEKMPLKQFVKNSKKATYVFLGLMSAATIGVGYAIGKAIDKHINKKHQEKIANNK